MIQVLEFPNLSFTEEVFRAIHKLRPSIKVGVLNILGRLNSFGHNSDYIKRLKRRGDFSSVKIYDDFDCVEIFFKETPKIYIVELYITFMPPPALALI